MNSLNHDDKCVCGHPRRHHADGERRCRATSSHSTSTMVASAQCRCDSFEPPDLVPFLPEDD